MATHKIIAELVCVTIWQHTPKPSKHWCLGRMELSQMQAREVSDYRQLPLEIGRHINKSFTDTWDRDRKRVLVRRLPSHPSPASNLAISFSDLQAYYCIPSRYLNTKMHFYGKQCDLNVSQYVHIATHQKRVPPHTGMMPFT